MSVTQDSPAGDSDTNPEFRIDREDFVEWAEQQIEHSLSTTARIIANTDEQVKFRIREERDGIEDIILVDAGGADILRFERTVDTDTKRRQFSINRYEVTFHPNTLKVKTRDGAEICRAGTTTTSGRKGPFPSID